MAQGHAIRPSRVNSSVRVLPPKAEVMPLVRVRMVALCPSVLEAHHNAVAVVLEPCKENWVGGLVRWRGGAVER